MNGQETTVVHNIIGFAWWMSSGQAEMCDELVGSRKRQLEQDESYERQRVSPSVLSRDQVVGPPCHPRKMLTCLLTDPD